MDSLNKMRKNPLKNLKRNLHYKTSNKYIYSTPKNANKTFLKTGHEFENALSNLREGLEELSQESPDQSVSNTYDLDDLKRISYTTPKLSYLRAKTPKRTFDLRRKDLKYLNTSNILSTSYIKTSDDFSGIIEGKNKFHHRIHPSLSTRKRSKTGLFNDINNVEIIYNTNINEFSKPKEIIMLNNILKKQNKEFRIKAGEMRHKMNELLNNLILTKMDNQKLNNEKKELMMKISYLENEMEINKNMTSNEIELKNNTIEKLKNEIMELNILLDKKEEQIVNLTNIINNLNNTNNTNFYSNANYNNQNQDIILIIQIFIAMPTITIKIRIIIIMMKMMNIIII